jgi:type IV fimbrial biogenesis protein FimT
MIAILSSLAAPSFTRLIAKQRDKTHASELFIALTRARSEALKRNLSVTLSAKPGGWAQGWQIVDPGDATRFVENRGPTAGVSITGPASASVIFSPSGRLAPGTAPTFVITTAAGSFTFYQCVSVHLSGRPYMAEGQSC